MEREKGFESRISPDVSGAYVDPENAPESRSQPPDAWVHVSTELIEGDTGSAVSALPLPAPELFFEAGFIVAGRAARAAAGQPVLEGIVRRACGPASCGAVRSRVTNIGKQAPARFSSGSVGGGHVGAATTYA